MEVVDPLLPLRDHLRDPRAAPGQLPHGLALLRPGRGLRLPPGADGDGDPVCPLSVSATPPRPAHLVSPPLLHSNTCCCSHICLGGFLCLALHQVNITILLGLDYFLRIMT